ncbi:polysaccharide deacetylase [Anaerosporomusa subterranea]|uniref:Polysaccharide deacetylase n=1 Tax=Anaerosporomusa subterranea TaxID=1794912 RepID=A0A154BTA0_ANASB|nr:polysaccharide deacetylase family protein [Anaerosporomusa subterranea]KYZ77244.1 polysaccharide deacetylase [Anaerosporomusa subterranea]
MKFIFSARIPPWYVMFTLFTLTTIFFTNSLADLGYGIPTRPGLTPIFQGNRETPKVAFACNVFWGEDIMPDMLNILADNQVKATFFIGGSWARRHPESLKLIADAGHELGNHSFTHPHPNRLSKEQNQAEIIRTEKLIEEVTGIKTRLYAPPYGEYNHLVLEAAQELNYLTIMWTADTIDWRRPSPDVIIKRIEGKLQNGAIILMHPTEPTLKALPVLIRLIKARGYTIETVSDIIK